MEATGMVTEPDAAPLPEAAGAGIGAEEAGPLPEATVTGAWGRGAAPLPEAVGACEKALGIVVG